MVFWGKKLGKKINTYWYKFVNNVLIAEQWAQMCTMFPLYVYKYVFLIKELMKSHFVLPYSSK